MSEMTVASKVLTCCHAKCGLVYAVPLWWEQKRREDHTTFYCPNGHSQSFDHKTDAEKLREEKARLEQRLQAAANAAEQSRVEKEAAEKKLRRVQKREASLRAAMGRTA